MSINNIYNNNIINNIMAISMKKICLGIITSENRKVVATLEWPL